jgi:hypothetical protein
MSKLLAACSAIGLMLVSAAGAQTNLTGTWSGNEKMGENTRPVVLKLNVTGDTATGTITIGQNPSTALSDGRVSGATVTFKTAIIMNGKEATMSWTGQLKKDMLSFTRTLGERKLQGVVLERSK